MEDQTIQQETQQETPSYDASADGLAYGGYEEPTLEPTLEPEPEIETPPDTLKPDGVAIDENGEVSFGDDFFAGMEEQPPETAPRAPEPQAYTADELKSTPFEQWDLSRLKGDISQFAPIVREQLQQRSIQQQAQTAPLPDFLRVQPKDYTPKELSEAGLKLACEKLGITDIDDFDSYEAEHQAAYQMATRELLERRNAEMMSYQTGAATWPELVKVNAELARQPDFNEFNQWYVNELAKRNITPKQMEAGLLNYVRVNGNDFRLVTNALKGWYRQFQQERGGVNVRQGMRPTPTKPRRVTAPPTLEGTRGSGYEGEKRVDLRRLGDMTADEQANALIRLGIV